MAQIRMPASHFATAARYTALPPREERTATVRYFNLNRREARVAPALDQPHICTIMRLAMKGARPFSAIEYLDCAVKFRIECTHTDSAAARRALVYTYDPISNSSRFLRMDSQLSHGRRTRPVRVPACRAGTSQPGRGRRGLLQQTRRHEDH